MKKNFLLRKYFFLFLVLTAVVFFISCSRTEPRIPFGFIELVYYPVDGRPQERFSFFVIAEDDDGFENLSELRLVNDREGLEWILDLEDWVHYEESGSHWIGSRSIAMVEGVTLPRGLYRAVLINKGGDKTEYRISFDVPETPRFPFPTLNIIDGRYRIDSMYPENFFIVYDQQGNILRTMIIYSNEGDTVDLNIPGNGRLLALWAQDSEYHTSALTEAVSFQ